MVVEYLLVLLISITMIAGAFGLNTGPAEMLKRKSPVLAYKIESNLETGGGFNEESWL